MYKIATTTFVFLFFFLHVRFGATFQCYSCASTLFKTLWNIGSGTNTPLEWTDNCHRDPQSYGIPLVQCDNSPCFTQKVTKIKNGKVVTEGTIRGCWSRLFSFPPLTDKNCITVDLADGTTTACYCEKELCNVECFDKTDCFPITTTPKHPQSSCLEWKNQGYTTNGVYALTINGKTFNVYCDLEDGGWIVIQRRVDNSTIFDQNWNEYLNGFPGLNPNQKVTNFWLGLAKIHTITNHQATEMKIDLWDCFKRKSSVLYDSFQIGDSSTNYRLHVSAGQGSAGDAFNKADERFEENDMQFTTKDYDNDKLPNYNCAALFRGGWWFNDCGTANLNGLYYKGCHYTSPTTDGIIWSTWQEISYSAYEAQMKVRWK